MNKQECWNSLTSEEQHTLWDTVYRECNNLSIDQLEDILEDREYLKSIADIVYPLSQTKIR